jgi:hypothetical protein
VPCFLQQLLSNVPEGILAQLTLQQQGTAWDIMQQHHRVHWQGTKSQLACRAFLTSRYLPMPLLCEAA